jgi:hypothetical protein
LLANSTEALVNTFEDHKFIIRLIKHGQAASISADDSSTVERTLVKKGYDETIIVTYNSTRTPSLIISQPDSHDHIRQKINKAVSNTCNAKENEKEFLACIKDTITNDVKTAHESKNLIRKYQDDISLKLRNYTCADPYVETSPSEYTYPIEIDEKEYQVNVLLDMKHAKIWYVNDFITKEECDILEKHGKPLLHRATVAAEDGTSVVSEHRKANQASYDLHQHHGEKDPLWNLHTRVLRLTNYHANYSLDTPGQEGLTIIQYNPSDEYQ